MVPPNWKGKQVRLKIPSQTVEQATLDEITDSGVALSWSEQASEQEIFRRVFIPWHTVQILELTDPDGPAEPRVRTL